MDRAWVAWLALGALLGPAEVATRRLFLGPSVIAALGASAVAAAGGRFGFQVGTFALITAVGLAARRVLLRPYLGSVARHGWMAGRATVVEQVTDDAGRVRYGGMDWAARSSGTEIPPRAKVLVLGMDGKATLRVYPVDAARRAARELRDAPVARVSGRQASAARGRLSGGYLLTPEERLKLTTISLARWRYTDRLLTRLTLACVGAGSAFMLVSTVLGVGPALHAAQGKGVRGVFTAQTQSCSSISCRWEGTFISSSGQTLPEVDYNDKLPAGTRRGSNFPALYPGGSNEVFAVHGSRAWLAYAWFAPLGAAGLLGSLWLGPIKYLRRRHEWAASSFDQQQPMVDRPR